MVRRITEEDDEARSGWKTTTVFGTEDIGHHFKITRDGQTRSYEIVEVHDSEGYGIQKLTVRSIDSGS